ncbi:MAG: 8-amino-7-oxononanoate synthase, partial [Deltaproteobacteria bacterium]|nr:8-amino-7-oxononanoate synthase [Deltaproteobacteria bacterium]
MNAEAEILAQLEAIRKSGLYRTMSTVSSPQGPEFVLDGRSVVNFSGNDSLGLANHPRVRAAAHRAIDEYGAGSGASRLTSGNLAVTRDLEDALAQFLGSERTLLFSSGFQANSGVIPALAGPRTLILSDQRNHASLIDGIRLSRARRIIYPHNDVQALGDLLDDVPRTTPVMVVTESLFSMDGDRAPLNRIAELKRERPFLLYVDEAHAMGVLGPGGRGLAADCGLPADVLIGTLGKAFGASGAFIAASSEVIDLLVNRARSFIYSTAPMPAAAGAALAALELIREGDGLRTQLKRNSDSLRERLAPILGAP